LSVVERWSPNNDLNSIPAKTNNSTGLGAADRADPQQHPRYCNLAFAHAVGNGRNRRLVNPTTVRVGLI
jgi:hypothetical protein